MIEVESGALDHTRVWEAARALLDYLDQGPARTGRVLELGSGTGWLGLHLAQRWPGAEVVLSDRADVLPQLEANVARNASRAAVQRGDYALDFDDVAPWDLVVGSDLVYT